MMEILIEIPEEDYKLIKETEKKEPSNLNYIARKIVTGTVLPKGHGRLIDADALKKDDEVTEWISLNPVRTGKMLKCFSELFVKKIDATKTIIEADKESEE